MRYMLNKNRLGITVTLCIVLLACTGTAFYWNDKRVQEYEAVQQAAISISGEVNKLRALIDRSGGKQYDTRIVLQGSIPISDKQWELERKRWLQTAEVQVTLQAVQERGRQVFRVSYKLIGGDVNILFFEEENDRSYYVITASGQEEGGMKQVTEEIKRLYLALANAGYKPEWNAALKTRIQADRTQAWGKVESALSELGEADALDYYEDERSISVSYTTSYMDNELMMQGQVVNLQAAVHENEEQGFTQVTFGSPLINGEY